MKRFATILCSAMFLIAGILLSNIEGQKQNQLHASPPITVIKTELPLDLQLDLAKRDSSLHRIDTVIQHDTVHIVKYKIKYRAPKKSIEPDSLPTSATSDTLCVPELKVRIQMGEDVLMDSVLLVNPELLKHPKIQPLQESEE